MGIRIQPREIDFPELHKFGPDHEGPDLDPFQGDLLDRKEKIEVLSRLVGNIEGPCAMAVDAAWGAGKTTFLKMWARHLRQQGFPVVEFNAWETDFTGDPFVALSSEITGGLTEWNAPTVADKIKETKETARKVLRWVAPGAIRLASGFIPVVGNEFGKAAGDFAEELFTDYPEARQSITDFKADLAELANELWENSGTKPLVVFIDELDRCRPSYAIELLETGKHIFSVDHVVFVLAVNRMELAKSVKVLYGDKFDAGGYLKRFFDIDFLLPAPDRDQFIDGLFDTVGIKQYLTRTNDRLTQNVGGEALEIIRRFFGRDESELSLRTIGQSIHRFGLIVSSLSDDEKGYVRTLAVLTVMATISPSLYLGFVSGELTDKEVAEALFHDHGPEGFRETPAGITVESTIIAARANRRDFSNRLPEDLESRAPLLFHYRGIADRPAPTDRAESATWSHAYEVCKLASDFLPGSLQRDELLGFGQSVQRFELLSPDLFKQDGNA